MRIGIIGLGSIGRRHVDCLQHLGIVEIYALRSRRGSLTKSKQGVKDIDSWDEFLELDLDAYIIASPTSLHLEALEKLDPIAKPCLVEKPLYSSSTIDISEEFQKQIRVAYCMRFHGLYTFLEKFVKKHQKELKSMYFERGYFLPNWHAYADYRTEYSAKKSLGGGVVRTLSHELDLVIKWFGRCELLEASVERRSDLEIDVEDFAQFELKTKDGVRLNFQLDFINPVYTNKGFVQLNDERFHFDFSEGRMWSESSNETIFEFDANELHEMYIEQMRDFIQFIKSGSSENCSFDEALHSLELIDQIAPH